MFVTKRVTIVSVTKPSHEDINDKLQWFGDSLGLFNLRDKDRSCFRIFIELLKAAKLRKPLSSDDLALKLGITRGTIVHHLNKLMSSGIVVSQNNKYMLRVDNLKDLVDEIKRDVDRSFNKVHNVAKEIDGALGL